MPTINFISKYLQSNAEYNPDGLIVVYGDERVSWSRMNERVNCLSQALLRLGIKKDDKVSFMFHNSPRFLEVNYAIQKAGAIPVPVNYRFTPRELIYQANQSDSIAFIFEDLWDDVVKKSIPELSKIKHFIRYGADCPKGMLDYEEILANEKPIEPEVPTKGDDICVIVYTGGTTGFPKGVMLTYNAHIEMFARLFYNLIKQFGTMEFSPEMMERIKEALPITGLNLGLLVFRSGLFQSLVKNSWVEEKLTGLFVYLLEHPFLLRLNYKNQLGWMCPSLPLFHDASYQIIMLATFSGNLYFIFPTSLHFSAEEVLRLVEKEKPKLLANVPTGWKMLVEYPKIQEFDLSSVVITATGAGLCPASLKKEILKYFPKALMMDLFGQTEMTPLTSFRIDQEPEKIQERSVGKPIITVKIIDENGKELPKGEIGEIVYKSRTVMKGYYKDEQKSREVFKDGWFYSGDLGYIDENGELRVVERKKECINTGGEKVFPLEVEEIIMEHPKVKNVCVIGVPDETWGNIIRAVVQLKEGSTMTQEELIEFTKKKLAGYKCPRSVVFVDEFPLSPVGKVLRSKLKELYGKKIFEN